LTYPQCPYPLEQFASNVKEFFGDNLLHGVASRECHQDGNFHLHAALTLRTPFRTKNPRVFDSLTNTHPSIDGRFKGGPKKAYAYVIKDGNFLVLPSEEALNLEEFLESSKKETKANMAAKRLMSGDAVSELLSEEPGYVLLNLRKLQEFSAFLAMNAIRDGFNLNKEIMLSVEPSSLFNSTWNRQIARWLNKNIRQPREHKQKQLWINAKADAGKSFMIRWLRQEFKLSVYFWPAGETWNDSYGDGHYDVIVFDEFYGSHIMFTRLNQVLSGDTIPLSRRGLPPALKEDNLPCIILSNYSPTEAYSKSPEAKLEPLWTRIEYVEVPEAGKIRLQRMPETEPDDPTETLLSSPPWPDEAPPDGEAAGEEESQYTSQYDKDAQELTSFGWSFDPITQMWVREEEPVEAPLPTSPIRPSRNKRIDVSQFFDLEASVEKPKRKK